MAAANQVVVLNSKTQQSNAAMERDARASIVDSASNELVFGVVGHVGSGTSEIAEALKEALISADDYDVFILKARGVITEWANKNNQELPDPSDNHLEATEKLQDYGDNMRRRLTKSGDEDHSAVARGLIAEIRSIRSNREHADRAISGGDLKIIGQPKRVAYILDALRHPAEVFLLQRVYQEAFVLVGVVCDESKRLNRISKKYGDAGEDRAKKFMKRDAKAGPKYGQRVADAFHLSDFFLDNTADRYTKGDVSNPEWDVVDKLSRLVKIVTHSEVVRPEVEETAMHHAYGAMMQSACLSRQVGAALIDSDGDVVATGTNEVPKGGGGVYGEPVKGPTAKSNLQNMAESRCALRGSASNRHCSNTLEQNKIIDELIQEFDKFIEEFDKPRKPKLSADDKEKLFKTIRSTRIGGLIEFSRAVHAEMDALLTAGRTGASTVGTRLFVTVFPCHYCARHIVTAGVDEVQYIEPYPKSQAIQLHEDSIEVEAQNWLPPSKGGAKVLFRPFSGVAPRLYKRAFLKERDLKDSHTGLFKIGTPEWGEPWYLSKIGYRQMEQEVMETEGT